MINWAKENDNPALITQLLDAGANADAALLIWAAERGHKEIVKAFITSGYDTNTRSEDGRTILIWAAEAGHAGIVEQLLSAVAEANAATEDGMTALMCAATNGHMDIVVTLLASADTNANNKDGQTAAEIAANKGHKQVTRLIRDVQRSEIVQGRLLREMEGRLRAMQSRLVHQADLEHLELRLKAMEGRLQQAISAKCGEECVVIDHGVTSGGAQQHAATT